MKLKKRFIVPTLVAGTAAALFAFYSLGFLQFNHPKTERYPVWGIDVSHHQGVIEWGKIDREKIKFVFIKATEGGDFKDSKFSENWNKARANNFVTGAYHFFTLCRDGETQAKNFIESVPAEESLVPPVIDLEFVGNCSARPSPDKFEAELDRFIQLVETHYKKIPIFYTTYEFIEDYLPHEKFKRYPIWIRDVFGSPNLKSGEWLLWQFADNKRLEGIMGPVDVNVFNGDLKTFEEWKNGRKN